MKKTALLLLTLAAFAPAIHAKKTVKEEVKPDVFYVYSDDHDSRNHYIASGYMGDHGDIKQELGSNDDPSDGKTCIKIAYSAKGAQGNNWAGVFWQNPANNWGTWNKGINLNGYKKLTFWARGATGQEVVDDFKMGGINGTYSDTGTAATGPITLTKEWKKYTIDLTGQELSSIIGGFCWVANKDNNPNGFVIYLDEIRYEK